MNQNSFYLAMVGGMVAIVIALGFNAYATSTATVVECTSVYYTASVLIDGNTAGRVHHTCFNRDGIITELDTGGLDQHSFSSDEFVTGNPRFPPLGE